METFTDPAGGVSFTVTELDDNHATVNVTMTANGGGPVCMDGTTSFEAPGMGIDSCTSGVVMPSGSGGAGGTTGGVRRRWWRSRSRWRWRRRWRQPVAAVRAALVAQPVAVALAARPGWVAVAARAQQARAAARPALVAAGSRRWWRRSRSRRRRSR